MTTVVFVVEPQRWVQLTTIVIYIAQIPRSLHVMVINRRSATQTQNSDLCDQLGPLTETAKSTFQQNKCSHVLPTVIVLVMSNTIRPMAKSWKRFVATVETHLLRPIISSRRQTSRPLPTSWRPTSTRHWLHSRTSRRTRWSTRFAATFAVSRHPRHLGTDGHRPADVLRRRRTAMGRGQSSCVRATSGHCLALSLSGRPFHSREPPVLHRVKVNQKHQLKRQWRVMIVIQRCGTTVDELSSSSSNINGSLYELHPGWQQPASRSL